MRCSGISYSVKNVHGICLASKATKENLVSHKFHVDFAITRFVTQQRLTLKVCTSMFLFSSKFTYAFLSTLLEEKCASSL